MVVNAIRYNCISKLNSDGTLVINSIILFHFYLSIIHQSFSNYAYLRVEEQLSAKEIERSAPICARVKTSKQQVSNNYPRPAYYVPQKGDKRSKNHG